MSRRFLPRRMNAMSIQEVAAAEEFATQTSNDGSLSASSIDKTSSPPPEQSPTPTPPTQINLERGIQKSLEKVGNGIQALLSESLTSATGDVATELQSTVQQHVQAAIRKSLPSLSQQLQKEAKRISTIQAEQVAKKTSDVCLAEFKTVIQQQHEIQQRSTDSMITRLDEIVSQNTALKQTNEEQRKVIVALVKKVGALEERANITRRHQQKTDQRLARAEQPTDLNAEWTDLMSAKEKPDAEDTHSTP
ncbi:MAG: hypothetical protein ABJZ55_18060 [Fuerstiella sp.]